MRTKCYRFKIRGETWKFIMMSPGLYKKRHPEMATDPAVTLPNEREVNFLAPEFEKRHVFHELLHVFTSYMHTDSADLTFAQGEEMFADFFGDYAEEFFKTGTKIYRKIKPTRRGLGSRPKV